MPEQLKTIQKLLIAKSNKAALAAQENFVPGVNSKVYGVRMPVLNDLAKQFKAGGFELVKELWDAGAFEEKILAVKILGCIAKRSNKVAATYPVLCTGYRQLGPLRRHGHAGIKAHS